MYQYVFRSCAPLCRATRGEGAGGRDSRSSLSLRCTFISGDNGRPNSTLTLLYTPTPTPNHMNQATGTSWCGGQPATPSCHHLQTGRVLNVPPATVVFSKTSKIFPTKYFLWPASPSRRRHYHPNPSCPMSSNVFRLLSICLISATARGGGGRGITQLRDPYKHRPRGWLSRGVSDAMSPALTPLSPSSKHLLNGLRECQYCRIRRISARSFECSNSPTEHHAGSRLFSPPLSYLLHYTVTGKTEPA